MRGRTIALALVVPGVLALGLAAITAANLITTHYAAEGHPEVSVYTAFGLVAFDFVARDVLHDFGGRRRWLYIGALVVGGSVIAYAVNRDAATATIALASCVAFAAALVVDTVAYEAAKRRGWWWLERSNASNIAGAAVDSVVFVAIAFPGFLFTVAFGQFTAKVAGGVLFSLLLWRAANAGAARP